jgi:hypothetical protein
VTVNIAHVDIPTTELIVIEDFEDRVGVTGAFVKVSPLILNSAKAAFDGARITKAYREGGAVAVVLAPVYVDDVQNTGPAEIKEALTPHATIDQWFELRAASADESITSAAKELVQKFLEKSR